MTTREQLRARRDISPSEIQDLIGRAQRLQDEARRTEAEARAIGGELDIEPRFIDAALAERDARRAAPTPARSPLWPLLFGAALLLAGVFVGVKLFGWYASARAEVAVAESSVEIKVESHTSHTSHTSHEIKIEAPRIELPPMPGAEVDLDALASRLFKLVEEARPLIGGQMKAIDALAEDVRRAGDPAEKRLAMKKLTSALHDAVFFGTGVGDAAGAAIREGCQEIDRALFFSAPLGF
jgi:hypothetical protein